MVSITFNRFLGRLVAYGGYYERRFGTPRPLPLSIFTERGVWLS
jgi:hypothetical protein